MNGAAEGVYFPTTGGNGTSIISVSVQPPMGDLAQVLISHDKQAIIQASADIVAGTYLNGADVMIMQATTSFSIRTPSKNLFIAPHPQNDTIVNVGVMVQ